MSLERFLRVNKAKRENVEFAASTAFTDEEGNPIKWVIKPLDTKTHNKIKDACITEVQVEGKFGLFRPKMDIVKYETLLIARSVVFPDLESTELQDSYGVVKTEDLVREMLDNPGEFDALSQFVQKLNGLNKTLSDKVDEAKN